MNSYLSNRKQCVYIDGSLSKELPVEVGVPQGSILGPLFYIIYTSDLPETVHNHGAGTGECLKSECGSVCCYADDSTFTMSGTDPEWISQKIKDKYDKIATYMLNNRLVLNSDKTHLLIMASSL